MGGLTVGHGRQAAAAVWLLSVVLAAAGVVFAVRAGQSLTAFAQSFSLGSMSAAVSFATVGAVIVTQRPGHVVARMFLGLGVVFGLTTACAGYALEPLSGAALPAAGTAGWLLNWVWVPGYALLGLSLLVFPDGAPPSSR